MSLGRWPATSDRVASGMTVTTSSSTATVASSTRRSSDRHQVRTRPRLVITITVAAGKPACVGLQAYAHRRRHRPTAREGGPLCTCWPTAQTGMQADDGGRARGR